MAGGPAAEWRSADDYAELLFCDRRAFAWEWLRRSPTYRQLWAERDEVAADDLAELGLLGWVDPSEPAPLARPIWSRALDKRVLLGRPADEACAPEDLFDIRSVAPLVTVEIDRAHAEHWLLSDGHWAIRLDLHEGTLLGGPILVEHRVTGLASARPKLEALRQFVVLAETGRLPATMMPRERRAAQWIAELRTADALVDGASQQDIARALFGGAISPSRWRLESASYRLRVQRLTRIARERLGDPLSGPWFD